MLLLNGFQSMICITPMPVLADWSFLFLSHTAVTRVETHDIWRLLWYFISFCDLRTCILRYVFLRSNILFLSHFFMWALLPVYMGEDFSQVRPKMADSNLKCGIICHARFSNACQTVSHRCNFFYFVIKRSRVWWLFYISGSAFMNSMPTTHFIVSLGPIHLSVFFTLSSHLHYRSVDKQT